MNWKTAIQVRDLSPEDRLELTCRKCGHLRYLTAMLYLDEVEARALCSQHGCKGQMRIALPAQGETSGFIGGIA